ncbi:MAG: EamA family transporter [Clostridia bacterium]|nr:EamA family transporter [Clostridia bacterium]MBQ2091962.1 EamA family transporter [Clostridia bacterium]MBQ3897512.1 EamA family transporter [Clostridia bacterium]
MKNKEFTGVVFVIIAGILWGTTGIYVRYFTDLGMSSLQITVFKMFIAAVVLLLWCLIRDREALKVKKSDIWVFMCTGFISMDFFTVCYFSTIQQADLSVAATLLYGAPAIVMLLSIVLFKEKFSLQKGVACVIAFLGCFLVSGLVGSGIAIPGRALLTGVLSAIGYALYSIFGRIALDKGYSSLTITTYTFLFAFLGSLVLLRPAEVAAAASVAKLPVFLFMLVAIAINVSLLPYVFYTNGLARINASKASIIASVEPVTATVVGALVFKEYPDIYGYLGIICVLFAIILLNIRIKNRKNA